MKTSLQSSPAVVHGINQADVSIMGMDQAGMRQACQVFRDAIYSNKVRAVVREWTCNAIDEHIKFDVERPAEIGVTDGEFYVRDFANGLSEHLIRNVFGQYFRSTKSGSDDFIGGFGVGAKAGHCYGDTFTVESHFEGTKTFYSCVLSADDEGSSVGNIIKLHSEPTTETGLRVSIPIKPVDIQDFYDECRAAQKASVRGITINLDKTFYQPTSKELLLEKDGFKVFRFLGSGKLFVTMGGVRYTMDKNAHSEFTILEKNISINKSIDIQIDVPVGSMDIPISREVIKPTVRSFTTCEKIRGTIQELFQSQIEAATQMPLVDILENYKGELVVGSDKDINVSMSYFMDKQIVNFMRNCDMIGEFSNPIAKKDGKILCVLMPHSWSAQNRAMDHARAYCRKYNVYMLGFKKNTFESLTEANRNAFKQITILRSASTLEMVHKPKTHRAKDVFAVRRNMKSEPMTALELHNQIHKLSHSEDEAKAYLADVKNIKYVNDVKRFELVGGKILDYYIQSGKGQQALRDLGYRSVRPAEVVAHLADLRAAAEQKQQLDQKINQYTRIMSQLGSNTSCRRMNRLKLYHDTVYKILTSKTEKGHTISYKIIKKMVDSQSLNGCFTRAEIRKIIKMEA